ncbi:hypothetical protein D3C81_573280 [compost metagenome]
MGDREGDLDRAAIDVRIALGIDVADADAGDCQRYILQAALQPGQTVDWRVIEFDIP